MAPAPLRPRGREEWLAVPGWWAARPGCPPGFPCPAGSAGRSGVQPLLLPSLLPAPPGVTRGLSTEPLADIESWSSLPDPMPWWW